MAARIELRKVVWPEREETIKTTYVVFIFAIVMGLFFWGLDWVLTWLTRLLTGQSRLTNSERLCPCDGMWFTPTRISSTRSPSRSRSGSSARAWKASSARFWCPTEEVVEMRDGQKRKSDRKFFPGYVLVQMEMDEDTWHLVKEVPKVLGFIGGTSDKPAAITDKEAMSILRRVEEGVDKPKPKVLFEPGEVVRVTDGPFNDFNGVVESVNYEKNRLQVAVQILGRSTPVELDFSQVEKG